LDIIFVLDRLGGMNDDWYLGSLDWAAWIGQPGLGSLDIS